MLTKDLWETLPEEAKGAFALDGDVYIPAKDATLKATLSNISAERDQLKGQLSDFQTSEQAKIEAAKKQAFDEALAEALKTGNVEAQQQLFDEQKADMTNRHEQEIETWKGKLQAIGDKMSEALVDSLSIHATDAGKAAFKLLVKSRVQVDPETGKEIYLNTDGSASSLNKEQFIAELKKDAVFMPVMKGDISVGNGILGGGSSQPVSKSPKEMTTQERIEFKQRDPEGFKKAFNL